MHTNMQQFFYRVMLAEHTILPCPFITATSVHKDLLGYIHVTAEQYINGGPGPGVPAGKGVPKLPSVDARDKSILEFVKKVKWQEVKDIQWYDSEREDGTGKGAFDDGVIPDVPEYLQHIVEYVEEEAEEEGESSEEEQ